MAKKATAAAPEAEVSTAGSRPRITVDERAQIVADLEAGNTIGFVADKFGRSLATIGQIKRSIATGGKSPRASGGGDDLKSDLLSYAIQILLDPGSITEDHTKALRERVQQDMVASYVSRFG